MAADRIRVGIIGLGAISFSHEAAYGEMEGSCQVVAMSDVREEEAASRSLLHGARTYTRYQELLDSSDVDMVDIIVPHHLHYEVALAAIQRGKHVLVEKPIAVNSWQGQQLIDAAQKAGVTLGVAENTRFVTAYQKAEEIVDAGWLGDILVVRTLIAGSEVHRIKDPGQWHGKLPYGGVILDSSVHNFYLFKWLFGGVRDVRAMASRLVPEAQAEDNGLMLGRLANGAEYQLYTSCTIEIPWTERLEVYGSKGGLVIDQLANPVAKYFQGSGDFEGTVVEGVPFDPFAWKHSSIVAEVKDFVSALADRRRPLVDPSDALYALKAAEAAERSIQLGEPVAL